jgi:hypothetical protein
MAAGLMESTELERKTDGASLDGQMELSMRESGWIIRWRGRTVCLSGVMVGNIGVAMKTIRNMGKEYIFGQMDRYARVFGTMVN